MRPEDIAMICHETNRAYCRAIGDDSQPPWEAAPDWHRASFINGVAFHLGNPDSTPADSHNSWMKQKLDDGWEYGPVKDPEKKQHPCIVSYNELPIEQRMKDYLFVAIVRTLEKEGSTV